MVNTVKEASTLIELIYALEPLCYYFSMKPKEFWNSTYREINLYTQANLCHKIDDLKQEIQLQEAVTNKVIMADAMSNRKPKIISLYQTFERLFPENKQEEMQSAEEITKRMRMMMKTQTDKKL